MSIGQILTDIGTGLASIVPSFFGAIWEGFAVLFLTYTEAEGVMTVTGFNALGSICIAFVILAICYKILPAITSFLGKRISASRKRRAKASK